MDNVRRARSLIGTRFRAQGRKPDIGIDCLGVVLHACRVPAEFGRMNYRLRGDHTAELRAKLGELFDEVPSGQPRAGDVLLFRIAPEQLHLAVCCGESFVHADAAIGRVVETPGPPPWPLISAYRRPVGGG